MPCIDEGFSRFGKSDWFSIRRFAGDTIHEVRFKKEVMDLTMDSLSLLFASRQEGQPDLTPIKQRE